MAQLSTTMSHAQSDTAFHYHHKSITQTSSLPQQRAHKDNDNGACVLTFLTSNRFLLSFSMAFDLDVVAGVSTGSTSTSMSAMVAMKVYSGGGRNACQIRFRLCM